MEVKIGVLHAVRELSFESAAEADEIEKAFEKAVTTGGTLRLVDERGNVVLVPGPNVGYLEIAGARRGGVGFGTL